MIPTRRRSHKLQSRSASNMYLFSKTVIHPQCKYSLVTSFGTYATYTCTLPINLYHYTACPIIHTIISHNPTPFSHIMPPLCIFFILAIQSITKLEESLAPGPLRRVKFLRVQGPPLDDLDPFRYTLKLTNANGSDKNFMDPLNFTRQ